MKETKKRQEKHRTKTKKYRKVNKLKKLEQKRVNEEKNKKCSAQRDRGLTTLSGCVWRLSNTS